ncbi:MAG: tRNA (guanosine(37)-N1)-methyltransferase TrmD [Parachlamydiales bacterium]|nr:tRNA (guanosine(37)-N1)-methyltransferase TrmD [Parachlamydiales bacterium]
MLIDILSLFPEFFSSPFNVSIIKRAIENNILKIRQVDIRDFSKDKHKKVDERPFGGGPGMVMTPQPLFDAIRSVKDKKSHVIYLSPQGKPLSSAILKRLAKLEHMVLVCGHYEGIDQRVIESEVDEEISIGDYVLTNGCIASLALIDAVSRFIPNVLGNESAALLDTFENSRFEGPQYTRPEIFEDMNVPEVLLSGNHSKIEDFKTKSAIEKMKKVRPDMYFKYLLQLKQKKHLLKKS